MTPKDRQVYPPIEVELKDGRKIKIRPLALDDGPKLAVFYESVPREDYRFYCPHPLTRQNAFRNAAAADSPFEVVLVMETEGGAIGGYAWFRWKEGATRSRFGICVQRGLQGTGAGRVLMTRLLEIAKRIGPSVMALTVQKANARAVELYQKLGFKPVREQMRGERFGFPPEPEFYMEMAVR